MAAPSMGTNRMHTTFICVGELYMIEQSPYCDSLTLLPLAIEFNPPLSGGWDS